MINDDAERIVVALDNLGVDLSETRGSPTDRRWHSGDLVRIST